MWFLKFIFLFLGFTYLWPCVHAVENNRKLNMDCAGLCAVGFAGFITFQFLF